jgi:RNA-directed DNA polymerase
LEETLRKAIEWQAKKLIEREKRKRFSNTKYQRRFRLRTGQIPKEGNNKSPRSWTVAPHFDPYYCIAHSKYLARTIWRNLLARKYIPKPAILYQIPKEAGGFRDIMVFSIPDAALANIFNAKLRDRNLNILSPFCYSYRADRGVFDAVIQLNSYLNADKVYVVQFDFSKYFDTIEHDYIKFLLKKGFFYVSPLEEYLISNFLTHKFAKPKDYLAGTFQVRNCGVPQGSSLSLFLSNIAAHELDRELERSNGQFVRFADDVVCVAYNHSDALRVNTLFREHGYFSGIRINYEKSPGIALMAPRSRSDRRSFFYDEGDGGKIREIKEFDYIGHKFRGTNILISSKGMNRIKKRISTIIYLHLLHNLKSRKLFNPDRIGGPFHDWDLVTCINEIKNYVYGGLKEQLLTNFLDKGMRIHRFKGLMSSYPLVTIVEQFAELDGWMVNVIRRALIERSKKIKELANIDQPILSDEKIISGDWYQFAGGIDLETKAPSFVLAWRAARKAFKQYGLENFESPSYYSTLFSIDYD